ncbi:hypothetical protein LINPERPRIM_LOCUS22384 [Linum perenne]
MCFLGLMQLKMRLRMKGQKRIIESCRSSMKKILLGLNFNWLKLLLVNRKRGMLLVLVVE